MTKAGPPMRWALFQAGGIGRAHDPQFACVYYRGMVHNSKNHMQAVGGRHEPHWDENVVRPQGESTLRTQGR